MEQVPAALAMALSEAFNMAWEVLWPLILGSPSLARSRRWSLTARWLVC
jgi:hypothetical protein